MSLFNWLTKIFTGTIERASPSDFLPVESIRHDVGANLLLIALGGLKVPLVKPPKVWLPYTPDTNSMDPSFDFGHNNILIAGADEVDHQRLVNFLKVGDVAVYRVPADFSQPVQIYAIHRIIKIGKDAAGRYFKFKGDNNPVSDPYLARDENIQWVTIGTIF